MTTERDLQEALEPLAGDPQATADRVLAALPAPRPAFPRWLAAGLGGIALGLLGGYQLWKADAAPQETAQQPEQTTVVEVEKEPSPQVEPPPPQVAALRTVIGRVTRRPRDGDSVDLHVTSELWAGDRVETYDESMAAILLRDGTELRLNAHSVMELVAERRLRLVRGELWAHLRPEGAWHIESNQGTVETEGAVVDVRAAEPWMRLATLEGRAVLRSPDGLSRLVKTGQACSVDDGILRNREYVAYPLELTAWQMPLLCGAPRKEVLALAEEMVSMLGHPEGSKMAESVLRELGPCSMEALLAALEPSRAMAFREVRRPAALLLRDVATFQAGRQMFDLLTDPDAEIRVAMFTAIVRVTGTERADARFWSMADDEDRAREARDWRMEVYR